MLFARKHHIWVRENRIRMRCCAECGYDLRANLLRCSECAAVPNAAERAVVAATKECSFLRYLLIPVLPLGKKPIKFNRFTDRMRKVAGLANNAAAQAGLPAVYPRHILATIAVEASGVGAEILKAMGVNLSHLAKRLAPKLTSNEQIHLDRQIAWQSHLLLYSAIAEAEFIGDDHVGTEHFVLALLARPDIIDESLRESCVNHRSALITLLIFQAYWRFAEGKIGKALSICEMLQCEPTASTLKLKAWILAVTTDSQFHRPGEALELAKQACTLTNHKDSACLDTTAICYAANGMFADAIRFSELAIAHAPEVTLPKYKARLQLFQNGQMYRESPTQTLK